MTLPPCPIAGHDNPHHWHSLENDQQIWHVDHRDGVPGIVCTKGHGLSRCYSAHVPEPTPDPEEWVRVPVGTVLPPETAVLTEYVTRESTRVMAVDACHGGTFYVTRSDLDAILKPAPTPAEKLAEALAAADVRAALKSAGLTLGAEK